MSLDKVFKIIQVVKDHPQPGIMFRDISSLLEDAKLFGYAMEQLLSLSKDKYDVVCGLESRGFLLATKIQDLTNLPQVMIRKQNKLPGDVFSSTYTKEYGKSETFQIKTSSIKPGQRVLLMDDLMATGGSLIAACDLVQQAGGTVAGIMVLIEFGDLKGREKIQYLYKQVQIHSLFILDSTDDTETITKNVFIPSIFRMKKFRPTVYPLNNKLPVLMWHQSMESFAIKTLQYSNLRPSYVDWKYFPDGMPNITLESSKTLMNTDLVFIMNLARKELFFEQQSFLIALPRQELNSLTIVIIIKR